MQKKKKLGGHDVGAYTPSYSGGWGRRIDLTHEAEVVVRQDCATALQPGQRSKTLSQKKKDNDRTYFLLLNLFSI